MRDEERHEEGLEEQGAAKGPRKNHGDVNEALVPGAPRSPIREERQRPPAEDQRSSG
jgi:hypothetical protein